MKLHISTVWILEQCTIRCLDAGLHSYFRCSFDTLPPASVTCFGDLQTVFMPAQRCPEACLQQCAQPIPRFGNQNLPKASPLGSAWPPACAQHARPKAGQVSRSLSESMSLHVAGMGGIQCLMPFMIFCLGQVAAQTGAVALQ